jgi:hypothetical protein
MALDTLRMGEFTYPCISAQLINFILNVSVELGYVPLTEQVYDILR